MGQAWHNAFVYDDHDQYGARATEFLREGLVAGQGVVVANHRSSLEALRDAVGEHADRVIFVDIASLYTRPARTVAAYCQTLTGLLESFSGVRMITEVQCGPTPTEWNEWIGYEAMLTHAIANLPVRVVCSFDAHETPDPVLDGVWRTHPEVLRDDWSPSPSFEPPEETLGRLAPEPERLDGLQTIAATGDLENLREVLARELRAANVPPAKALDMLVAATEVASNSRVHGGGIEEVRVGLADGRFVCEIADGGGGFEHLLAGYRPPLDGDPAGLWIARQRTWRLEFMRSADGFTARLWL